MHVIHCIAFLLLKYADGLSVNKLYLFREKNSLNLQYNGKIQLYFLGVFLFIFLITT